MTESRIKESKRFFGLKFQRAYWDGDTRLPNWEHQFSGEDESLAYDDVSGKWWLGEYDAGSFSIPANELRFSRWLCRKVKEQK